MNKIYSRFDLPESRALDPGCVDSPIYGIEYEKDGSKKVIIKGIENRYEQAQVFKEQCDVNNIVKRYTEGDAMALERVKTMYGDFTKTPKSLMESLNLVQDAKEAFAKLPLEIRQAYNHDPDQFIADIGSERFNGLMYPKAETDVVEEVKAE